MQPAKYHTVIFVPHARARFRKFRVSDRALKLGAVALGVSLILAFSSAFSFVAGLRSSSESARLRTENRRLKEATERYTTSIDSLRQRLESFEAKTRRLAILAGMNDTRELERGGTGGPLNNSGASGVGYIPGGESPASLREMGGRSADIQRRLDLLEGRFRQRNSLLASTPTIAPVVGIPTNGFGNRADPFEGGTAFHSALDISAAPGTPVVAPAGGIVTRAGWQNGYGRVIEISHGYGFATLYGHLETISVAEGDRVERGGVLGHVGSSGRSTGPHLHYEVHVDGEKENPLKYILNAF